MQELISSSGLRGLATRELSPELFMRFGIALSNANKGSYAVGHDVRLSSPLLARSLVNGLNAGGSNVLYLGLAPTPAVAFYSRGHKGGAVITASHNPPEYNGIKVFDSRGASVTRSFYATLLPKLAGDLGYANWSSFGSSRTGDGLYQYVEHVASASQIKSSWKVGLDPGNGATSITAPLALALSGCEVSTINLAPDGTFPGRGSEPDEKSLSSLCNMIRARHLDIGFGYDGDGDRLAIVDERGVPIPQDLALAFVAGQSVGEVGGGSVVVNVDTSALVDIVVESAGGSVYRSKVGDPYVLEKMTEKNSTFGGESCGAWVHPKYSLCPDGTLSSVIFLNFLERSGLKPSQLGKGLPKLHLIRRKVPCPNRLKQPVMRVLSATVVREFPHAKILSMDGIRADLPDRSWVLVRASGTEPILRITAESLKAKSSNKIAKDLTMLIKKTMEGLKRKL
jgi:phosphoglucosamine mutase